MKCKICKQELAKEDYIVGIKSDILKQIFFSRIYCFLILGYWWISGQLYTQIDKKSLYMHFSCFRKQPYGERFWILVASSYDRWIKAVYLGFAALLIIGVILAPKMSLRCYGQSDTFSGLFDKSNYSCYNPNANIHPYLFVIVGVIILFVYIGRAVPWYMANKYIKNKLGY